MRFNKQQTFIIILLISTHIVWGQVIPIEVHFNQPIRSWDGFGFNYVEEAQYRDISEKRQDYGGFSYLDDNSKKEILEMVFGDDGLKPGLVKMFLGPFHQQKEGGPFMHTLTTENMLYFVNEGRKIAMSSGRDFEIITTLYGPPRFVNKQKILRGRDFDPSKKDALAAYMVDWADFLVNDQKLPLKYISLHNEGDDWQRWPQDGGDEESHYNHDYNMYWPPELVVDFLGFMPGKLKEAGLGDIGLTPGECYGWDRFVDYGYANAICQNEKALQNLGLITSHGFISWGWRRWNPLHTSRGTDMIRAVRPDMHAWVTSTSWGTMDTEFIRQVFSNIYTSKVNAIIPWAGIQRPGLWVGGDPNAGSAFHVFDDGTYKLRKGYYFYKQVSRAGQPGMMVANTISLDAEVKVIAFSSNGTENPDAFIVINMGDKNKDLNIQISGSQGGVFTSFRSTDDENELYKAIGEFVGTNNNIQYEAPSKSVTTFYSVN